jgi:hypothetical protein
MTPILQHHHNSPLLSSSKYPVTTGYEFDDDDNQFHDLDTDSAGAEQPKKVPSVKTASSSTPKATAVAPKPQQPAKPYFAAPADACLALAHDTRLFSLATPLITMQNNFHDGSILCMDYYVQLGVLLTGSSDHDVGLVKLDQNDDHVRHHLKISCCRPCFCF